jgi:hypothetical protein
MRPISVCRSHFSTPCGFPCNPLILICLPVCRAKSLILDLQIQFAGHLRRSLFLTNKLFGMLGLPVCRRALTNWQTGHELSVCRCHTPLGVAADWKWRGLER